jgi:hypothetical protein
MIQRASRLPADVSPCPCCRKQPFHVQEAERLHWMECPPCELRTTRCDSLQEALHAWESLPREAIA